MRRFGKVGVIGGSVNYVIYVRSLACLSYLIRVEAWGELGGVTTVVFLLVFTLMDISGLVGKKFVVGIGANVGRTIVLTVNVVIFKFYIGSKLRDIVTGSHGIIIGKLTRGRIRTSGIA